MIGPLPFLVMWLTGLLAVALPIAVVWLGLEWRDDLVREDWKLWLALGLSALALFGRLPLTLLVLRGDRRPPHAEREADRRRVAAPDGGELEVETCGRPDGPTLVFTHGWGLNATVWDDAKRDLGDRFRIVTWDLPGLGRSKPGAGGESLDAFADALRAVVASVGGSVVLVGHSIGGMTILTYARRHAETLGREVAGVALVNTTYTSPDRTMLGRDLWKKLREPLIIPLMRLSVLLSPLLWLQNWMSYLNGSMHMAHRLLGFGRHATRQRVELSARLAAKGSPAVQARGNIAMLRWDASDVPPTLAVPTLVLTGGRDLITQEDAGQKIAAEAPGATLTRFDDAGHMGFLERPEDYDRAIGDFAERAFAALAPGSATAPRAA